MILAMCKCAECMQLASSKTVQDTKLIIAPEVVLACTLPNYPDSIKLHVVAAFHSNILHVQLCTCPMFLTLYNLQLVVFLFPLTQITHSHCLVIHCTFHALLVFFLHAIMCLLLCTSTYGHPVHATCSAWKWWWCRQCMHRSSGMQHVLGTCAYT